MKSGTTLTQSGASGCLTPDQLRAVETLLGSSVASAELLKGGGNNQVAKVVAGSTPYAAKFYFWHSHDRRDRLGAEFDMLMFLQARGVRCVPRPVAANRGARVALYEFVEGRKPAPAEVSAADVDRLAELLEAMWDRRKDPDARLLPAASEACFALGDFARLVGSRLERVSSALVSQGDDEVSREARECVEREVKPLFEQADERIRAHAAAAGRSLDDKLDEADRTLSPADHGFHNTLRRADGSLVFLDFEYAGWDDPAQMIGNACLQPEVPLPAPLRTAFVRRVAGRTEKGTAVLDRVAAIYPMLGLRWCLIMLNEFIPVDRERRAFSGGDPAARRAAQLEKSRRMLGRMRDALDARESFEPT